MVRAQNLVIDSGGFLKNADIRSMGEKWYTVKDVVAEIRDKATRQRLSFLPYELSFIEPSPESLQKVADVAKKTGDYSSLSSVDIKVLALTFQLAKQHDPESIREVSSAAKGEFQFGRSQTASVGFPGFYMPKKGEKSQQSNSDVAEDIVDLQIKDLETENLKQEEDDLSCEDLEDGDKIKDFIDEKQESSDSQDDEEVDDGWITPNNIQKIQQGSQEDDNKDIKVACITTDFAMQNVLMKMGLAIFSVDGMRIKNIRSYVLRCHACFCITKIMTKTFCPKCGNNTLKRVPMQVQPDGAVKYYLSKNPKVLSKRGKKTSLPMPKGGKHSQNPILCEDQPMPQDRVSKKSQLKTNVWSDEYGINGNPFALNVTESKAFKLGIRQGNRSGGRRGNPNAVNRKFVKRR